VAVIQLQVTWLRQQDIHFSFTSFCYAYVESHFPFLSAPRSGYIQASGCEL